MDGTEGNIRVCVLESGDKMTDRKYTELHLHLDGAITVEIARKLADIQNINLPSEDDGELLNMLSVSAECRNLNDFLKCFDLPLSLMQTREGVENAVKLVLANIGSQGVSYVEIRFAPQLHCSRGLTQKEVIEAAIKGAEESDTECNLILCLMRGNDNADANKETLMLAAEYVRLKKSGKPGVVALDLAGAEGLYKTDNYKDLFAQAKEQGVPFTIHAGEADGPESVWAAIEFGASRIGHGVKSVYDEELMKELAEKHICLEMCPTSNLQTKAVEDISRFPLRIFMEKGIPVTINTDDMAICRTTLKDEMELVKKVFNLSVEEENQLYENAVKYSFNNIK